jgi:hypothetical protein
MNAIQMKPYKCDVHILCAAVGTENHQHGLETYRNQPNKMNSYYF